MTAPDLEVMSAGITALGGQWRTGLTRDVTHLFALGPGSDKYETAMHFQADTHMKVVLPHWFDDAIKLGVGGLPTAGYEWPDPKYLRSDPNEEGGADGDAAGGKKGGTRKSQLSGDKKKLFQSVGWTEAPPPPEAMKDVWGGRKILLSLSLELSGGRREAVEAGIKRAGGVVVAYKKREGDGEPEEELKKVAGTAILVTRYRHGAAYLQVSHRRFTSAIPSSADTSLFCWIRLYGWAKLSELSHGYSTSNQQAYSPRPPTNSCTTPSPKGQSRGSRHTYVNYLIFPISPRLTMSFLPFRKSLSRTIRASRGSTSRSSSSLWAQSSPQTCLALIPSL